LTIADKQENLRHEALRICFELSKAEKKL